MDIKVSADRIHSVIWFQNHRARFQLLARIHQFMYQSKFHRYMQCSKWILYRFLWYSGMKISSKFHRQWAWGLAFIDLSTCGAHSSAFSFSSGSSKTLWGVLTCESTLKIRKLYVLSIKSLDEGFPWECIFKVYAESMVLEKWSKENDLMSENKVRSFKRR